jgi:multidrug resistance efflux pump
VGTVQTEQIATVTARVMANITEMRVSAGQRVTKGETLVVLDDRDLRHRVEQAQEAVQAAEATLEQARSDYSRDKPLFDQQVITPYDFEHTQTNLERSRSKTLREGCSHANPFPTRCPCYKSLSHRKVASTKWGTTT